MDIFLTLWNFKAGKSSFSTEVCQRTADLQITIWIKEVEIAKSIDEHVTSRSTTGQHNFPDFDLHDANDCVSLEESFATGSQIFDQKEGVEEQRAQKDFDRFLRGRQIAYMIYDVSSSVQHELMKQYKDVADLFSMTLQSDDVQDFDVRWVHAVLTVSEMPSDMIQEGLYKSKIGRHCSTSDCYGTVRSRNGANQGAELSRE